MRIELQDNEDSNIHYYLASWLKELAKGEDFPPVELHVMLVRYSFERETLSFHKFKNAAESIRRPLVRVPKDAGDILKTLVGYF